MIWGYLIRDRQERERQRDSNAEIVGGAREGGGGMLASAEVASMLLVVASMREPMAASNCLNSSTESSANASRAVVSRVS